jgi:hypothetical protein
MERAAALVVCPRLFELHIVGDDVLDVERNQFFDDVLFDHKWMIA